MSRLTVAKNVQDDQNDDHGFSLGFGKTASFSWLSAAALNRLIVDAERQTASGYDKMKANNKYILKIYTPKMANYSHNFLILKLFSPQKQVLCQAELLTVYTSMIVTLECIKCSKNINNYKRKPKQT